MKLGCLERGKGPLNMRPGLWDCNSAKICVICGPCTAGTISKVVRQYLDGAAGDFDAIVSPASLSPIAEATALRDQQVEQGISITMLPSGDAAFEIPSRRGGAPLNVPGQSYRGSRTL